MHKPILEDQRSYSFADYFNLSHPIREILAELGYQFQLQPLNLPQQHPQQLSVERLKDTFYRKLPHVSLNSEAAKREFFISPVLLELLDYLEIDIDIEYPIHISNHLQGSIDYVVRAAGELILIEAKNADMERGFTQLAVELIAMDQFLEETKNTFLYGAITTGDIWRFGRLERSTHIISKDLNAFVIPQDLEKLMVVLLGILGSSQPAVR
jgi:hypothetical protein